jgi:hypothetical protein
MRKSVFLGLAAAPVLGIGAFGIGQKSSVTSAQEKTSPIEEDRQLQLRTHSADRAGRSHGYVDQP